MKDKHILLTAAAVSFANLAVISYLAASNPEIVTRHVYAGMILDEESLRDYLRILIVSAVYSEDGGLSKSACSEEIARTLAPFHDEHCKFESAQVDPPKVISAERKFEGIVKYRYLISGNRATIKVSLSGTYEDVAPTPSNPAGIRINSIVINGKEDDQ